MNPGIAFLILLVGTVFFVWAPKPASASSRRTGWKWYLVVLALMLLVGYSQDAQVAWQAMMELPLLVALALYAWKQPGGSAMFWKVYGSLYPVWIAFILWVDSLPPEAQQPWQQVFRSSDPIRSVQDLAIELIGYATVIGPAWVVVWRLGHSKLESGASQRVPRFGAAPNSPA